MSLKVIGHSSTLNYTWVYKHKLGPQRTNQIGKRRRDEEGIFPNRDKFWSMLSNRIRTYVEVDTIRGRPIIFVLIHAREMIYRSFSKSNATRKEKEEWSHLHQEFNKKFQ